MNDKDTSRLVCSLEVQAGVIPRTPNPQFTRQYHVTKDMMDSEYIYAEIAGAAMNYAMTLQNPQIVNWVQFTWIYY